MGVAGPALRDGGDNSLTLGLCLFLQLVEVVGDGEMQLELKGVGYETRRGSH